MTDGPLNYYHGAGTNAERLAFTPNPPTPGSGPPFILYDWWETDSKTYWVFDVSDSTWYSPGGGGTTSPFSAPLAVPSQPGFDPNFAGVPAVTWTISNNNRTAQPASGSPYNHIMGTPANFTGKKYFEAIQNDTSFGAIGIAGPAGHRWDGGGAPFGFTGFPGQLGWNAGGTVASWDVNTGTTTLATIQGWASGNRLSVAADLDALLVWFRTLSGNWNNNGSADPATGVGGIPLSPSLSGGGGYIFWPGMNSANNGSAINMYLNTADFIETVPAGYTSWSGL